MTPALARLLPYLHYPVVVTTTFVLFAWLRAQGVSLVVSTYVPVLLAAAMVTLLELRFPHRSEWRPPVSEIKTDLGFMTVVQLAFPPPAFRHVAAERSATETVWNRRHHDRWRDRMWRIVPEAIRHR